MLHDILKHVPKDESATQFQGPIAAIIQKILTEGEDFIAIFSMVRFVYIFVSFISFSSLFNLNFFFFFLGFFLAFIGFALRPNVIGHK